MLVALGCVLNRELKKTFRQKSRLLSAMVRPLIWLFVIGGGVSSILPDDSSGTYQQTIVPGILGMTLLFGSMLSALTTVYDKESGVMRMFIISPLPGYGVILSKLASSTLAGILQASMLCILLLALQILAPQQIRWGLLIFGILITGITCSSIGLIAAVISKSLDNFAAIMNFVIFPIFFLSGALYPVQNLPIILQLIATLNPFTYGVDLLKHSLDLNFISTDFSITNNLAVLFIFSTFATIFASWKFSQEGTLSSLLNKLSGPKK